MTIDRGSLKRWPEASGSHPTGCFSTEVRTCTQPGRRAVTARIVGDLNSVLVLMTATGLPCGAWRSGARRRTLKASGACSRGPVAWGVAVPDVSVPDGWAGAVWV